MRFVPPGALDYPGESRRGFSPGTNGPRSPIDAIPERRSKPSPPRSDAHRRRRTTNYELRRNVTGQGGATFRSPSCRHSTPPTTGSLNSWHIRNYSQESKSFWRNDGPSKTSRALRRKFVDLTDWHLAAETHLPRALPAQGPATALPCPAPR